MKKTNTNEEVAHILAMRPLMRRLRKLNVYRMNCK